MKDSLEHISQISNENTFQKNYSNKNMSNKMPQINLNTTNLNITYKKNQNEITKINFFPEKSSLNDIEKNYKITKYTDFNSLNNFFFSKYSSFKYSKEIFYNSNDLSNYSNFADSSKTSLVNLNAFKEREYQMCNENQKVTIKPFYEECSNSRFMENNNTNFTDFPKRNYGGKVKKESFHKLDREKFNEFLANNRSFSQSHFMNTTNNNTINPNFNYDVNSNIYENYFNYQSNKFEGNNSNNSLDKSKGKLYFANMNWNNNSIHNTTKISNSKSISKSNVNNSKFNKKNTINFDYTKSLIANDESTLIKNHNENKHKSWDLSNSNTNIINLQSFKNKKLTSINQNINEDDSNLLSTNIVNNLEKNKEYNCENFNDNDNYENKDHTNKNSTSYFPFEAKNKFITQNINNIKKIQEEKKNPIGINVNAEKKIRSEIRRKINFIINKQAKTFCSNYQIKNKNFNSNVSNHLNSEKFKEKFSNFHKTFRHKDMDFRPLKYVIDLDFIEKYFQTPEELILMTFSQEDLKRIQADISYYIKDISLIQSTEALKLKNLKDMFQMESARGDNEEKNKSPKGKFKEGFFDKSTIDMINKENENKKKNKKSKKKRKEKVNNDNDNDDSDCDSIEENYEYNVSVKNDQENLKKNVKENLKEKNEVNFKENNTDINNEKEKEKNKPINTFNFSTENKENNEIVKEIKEIKKVKESVEIREMRQLFESMGIREIKETSEYTEESFERNNSIEKSPVKSRRSTFKSLRNSSIKKKLTKFGTKYGSKFQSLDNSIFLMENLDEKSFSLSPQIKIKNFNKKKVERNNIQDIVYKKEKDDSCKYLKTQFYHLYDSGIQRNHQRNDLLDNIYEKKLHEIDKYAMKKNLNDNLTNKFIEETNQKIKEKVLGNIFDKSPKLNSNIPLSEDLEKRQTKEYFNERIIKRNGIFDKKVDDIKDNYIKNITEKKFVKINQDLIKSNFISTKMKQKKDEIKNMNSLKKINLKNLPKLN